MRRRRVLVALAGLLALWIAVTVALFVYPRTADPTRADAIIVLSGDHGERLPRALMLIREGVSSRLVLDGEPDSQRHIDLCRGREPFEVICLRPDPDNTRAEAQAAGRLARDRGWDRVVVVTSTQHVARARLVFDRCIGGTVQMVAAAPPFSLGERVTQVMREWPKWAYTAVLSREC